MSQGLSESCSAGGACGLYGESSHPFPSKQNSIVNPNPSIVNLLSSPIIFQNPNLKLRKYHTIQSRRDKMQLPSEDKDIGEQSLHKHFRRPLVS